MNYYKNVNRLIRRVSILVVLGLACGAVLAQGPGPGGGRMQGQMFAAMDANNDGKVSRSEWDDFHERRFGALDANEDGALDLTEFKSRKKGQNRGK